MRDCGIESWSVVYGDGSLLKRGKPARVKSLRKMVDACVGKWQAAFAFRVKCAYTARFHEASTGFKKRDVSTGPRLARKRDEIAACCFGLPAAGSALRGAVLENAWAM